MVSDWPTPTVSISTTSKPAASQRSMASRVRRATPPSWLCEGEGRMKAPFSRLSRSIRVLSPKDRPARPRRRGIDRQHRHLQPLTAQHHPKGLDEGGLAHPRRPRKADAQRLAPMPLQRLQQGQRIGAMIRPPAFHKRDRAGQRPPLARKDAGPEIVDIHDLSSRAPHRKSRTRSSLVSQIPQGEARKGRGTASPRTHWPSAPPAR